MAPGKRTLTEQLVQRKAAGEPVHEVVPDLPRSGGARLNSSIGTAVGNATGMQLGDVRVHTGGASAEAAAGLGARAFTIGNDIHLGGGESMVDPHLMAHEAAHTLHQRGTGGGAQTKLAVSMPGDALEHEADRVADAALSGGTASVSVGAASATIQRETDPRLNYNTTGDTESKGLDATALPYGDNGGWNAQDILSKLTQVDEDANTITDQVRCGANAVLAIAINNGPQAVQTLIANVIKKGNDIYNALDANAKKDPVKVKRAADARSGTQQLAGPQGKLAAKKATYHDLSLTAHCMKLVISADPAGATTGHEVLDAQALVGTTHEGGYEGELGKGGNRIRDRDHLKSLTDKLSPGDAYTLNVDTDLLDRKPGRPIRLENEINHFVTLGKEKNLAAGSDRQRIFLYDPYPRESMSQFVYSDNPSFWFFFTDKDGVWKSVLLVGTTKAP